MTTITPTAAQPRSFDTGSEGCPQGQLPVALTFSAAEEKAMANPLQHLPVIGTIYRAFSDETLPPAVQIADSVVAGMVLGGPLGAAGTILFTLVKELATLKPDMSRPPVPDGMDVAGAEAGIRPVTPGTVERPGGSTTLATTRPDFLGGTGAPTPGAMVAGLAAYDWVQKTSPGLG